MEMINIALPKGRLGEKAYNMMKNAGYGCPALEEPGRKLIFENREAGVRYFWAKPSDVAIYVARGAADIGVVGKDILLEYKPQVYELADLKIGKCRMAVAAPKDFRDVPGKTLKVATKFPAIAGKYYSEKNRQIDIIELHGSIELGPVIGLSDVILDIVESGSTLKANGLTVLEEVCDCSARLVVNRVSMKTKRERIRQLIDGLAAEVAKLNT